MSAQGGAAPRKQLKIVPGPLGAAQQGPGQAQIVRFIGLAQVIGLQRGPLGAVALAPGGQFGIMGRAKSLFPQGKGIQCPLFCRVQGQVQLTAGIHLRAGGAGSGTLPADEAGGRAAGNGHQRTSLCQMLSVCRAPQAPVQGMAGARGRRTELHDRHPTLAQGCFGVAQQAQGRKTATDLRRKVEIIQRGQQPAGAMGQGQGFLPHLTQIFCAKFHEQINFYRRLKGVASLSSYLKITLWLSCRRVIRLLEITFETVDLLCEFEHLREDEIVFAFFVLLEYALLIFNIIGIVRREHYGKKGNCF